MAKEDFIRHLQALGTSAVENVSKQSDKMSSTLGDYPKGEQLISAADQQAQYQKVRGNPMAWAALIVQHSQRTGDPLQALSNMLDFSLEQEKLAQESGNAP